MKPSLSKSQDMSGTGRRQILKGRGLPAAGAALLASSRLRSDPKEKTIPEMSRSALESGTISSRGAGATELVISASQRREKYVIALFDAGVFLTLIGLCIFFTIASPYFLTRTNLANLGTSVAVDGIMAAGMTICLIAGQLDLSIGSVLGLSGVVVGELWTSKGLGLWEVLLIVIAVAVVVGLFNTFLIVNLGINSIIVTLAMGIALQGVAEVVSGGNLLSLNNPALTNFVNARPGGVPVPVIALAIVYVGAYVLLTHTRVGWHLYAAGGNRTAAVRSGIRVGSLYRLAFVISATLAAIAGVIYAAQGSTAEAVYGQGDTFLVITAVLLGGIGLGGGAGKIQRTLVGVLIIGVLTNGMILMNVQSYYQELAQGVVFVAAVVLAALKEKRLAR